MDDSAILQEPSCKSVVCVEPLVECEPAELVHTVESEVDGDVAGDTTSQVVFVTSCGDEQVRSSVSLLDVFVCLSCLCCFVVCTRDLFLLRLVRGLVRS